MAASKIYAVSLYGRIVYVSEFQKSAELFRSRLTVETFMNPTLANLFRLENTPRTEILEVKYDLPSGGYQLMDQPVSLLHDKPPKVSTVISALLPEEDLPE